MEHSYSGRRTHLPKPQPHELGGQSLNAQPLTTSLSTSTTIAQPACRQPKSKPKTDQEWEHLRPNIEQLYATDDLSLQDVMREMEEKYQFKASRKQYNNKILQWRIGKNVKPDEMRAIVRKARERKMENPSKASVFRVRNRPVHPDKIERFRRDKGLGEDVVLAYATTPSDISCITPPPSDCEITEQSSDPLFDGSSLNPSNPVEPRVSSAYYRPCLGSDSPVVLSNPGLRRLDLRQPLPSNNLGFNHQFPSSPRLKRHNSAYRRLTFSSLSVSAETIRYPLSPYVGHEALHSFTDSPTHLSTFVPPSPFDCFGRWRVHPRQSLRVALLITRDLFPWVCTIQDLKQYKEWSVIQDCLLMQYSLTNDKCEMCWAWMAIFLLKPSFYVPEADSHLNAVKGTFLLLEDCRARDSVGPAWVDNVDIGRIAGELTFHYGGLPEATESLIQAMVDHKERHPSLDVTIQGSSTRDLAEVWNWYERWEKMKRRIENVLGEDLPAILRMVGVDRADGRKVSAEGLIEIQRKLGEEQGSELCTWVRALQLVSKRMEDCLAEITDKRKQ